MKYFTSTDETNKLFEKYPLHDYPKGQILYYIGDEFSNLYLIKKGSVKVYDIDSDGNEKIIDIFAAGEIIPISFLLGSKKKSDYFYTTFSDSKMKVINGKEFRSSVFTDTNLSKPMAMIAATSIKRLQDRVACVEERSVQTKTYALLKHLAKYYGKLQENGWTKVIFPITQQVIAGMIGATRESVNVEFVKLQDMGIIRTDNLQRLQIKVKEIPES